MYRHDCEVEDRMSQQYAPEGQYGAPAPYQSGETSIGLSCHLAHARHALLWSLRQHEKKRRAHMHAMCCMRIALVALRAERAWQACHVTAAYTGSSVLL